MQIPAFELKFVHHNPESPWSITIKDRTKILWNGFWFTQALDHLRASFAEHHGNWIREPLLFLLHNPCDGIFGFHISEQINSETDRKAHTQLTNKNPRILVYTIYQTFLLNFHEQHWADQLQ